MKKKMHIDHALTNLIYRYYARSKNEHIICAAFKIESSLQGRVCMVHGSANLPHKLFHMLYVKKSDNKKNNEKQLRI